MIAVMKKELRSYLYSVTGCIFIAANLLSKATKHGVTTFCAPPTVWRFLVKEDLHKYDFRAVPSGAAFFFLTFKRKSINMT